ncbi:glycerol-3-phosphate 1-O-acyltransferase PlsY [Chengkuizengella axinellae]|uniref:Glycerol-3-phosphate acyltransferase n=1 Tax=Chengkuizengella axinellae TaxID=3064388 RepID=A0ABT9IWS6_9BACL|nr:glycerol-3-phosphate 1-O-acyltransferase PlsY [Chengkuizengella sp. 2205SS18-9]MDP5273783.1 glycerol-3-phosphate 1-O-acyltransferase PlsY [Chengkuizengella sp. 2205SS18-9]
MNFILPILISYLLGSISFSTIAAKVLKGIDIRNHGSGNAGATNALRVIGVGPGIAVLLLDVFKGILAVWIGEWFTPNELLVPVLCGLFVIAGHNWPVFFGFKGGKGIATTIGVAATIAFLPTLYAGLISIVFLIITRYVSLFSLLFSLLLPISVFIFSDAVEIFYLSIAIWLFAWFRHRSNIIRIIQGQERKVGQKG